MILFQMRYPMLLVLLTGSLLITIAHGRPPSTGYNAGK